MRISTLFSQTMALAMMSTVAIGQADNYSSNLLEKQLLEQYKHQRCQCTYRNELSLMQSAEVREARRKFTEDSDRWIAENATRLAANRTGNAIITIPVVFHVVYQNTVDNITDAQLLSQIDIFNADYRKLNASYANVPAEFQTVGADVEFEFCAASFDPQGNATNGITRVQTSITDIGNSYEVYVTANGGADAWDPDQYLNIWVAQIGGGTLGYAYLPGNAPDPSYDGLVISPDYIGNVGTVQAPLDGGRTGTHEIGHYFNLEHIWADAAGCATDDLVGDTPTQDSENYGCPTHPLATCGNNNMFMNYMDYTDDACMGIFTEGQKTRMLSAVNTSRSGLLTSNGCGGPASISNVVNNLHATVSPNPADEMLRVVINTEAVYTADLRLIDIMGRTVLQQTIERYNYLDVSALEAGIYIMEISQNNNSYTQKVVIR